MSEVNSFDDIDRELLDIFLEEAQDLMEACEGMLIRLRESPNGTQEIVGLQRALHTIKGGARMTGMMGVGDLSHSIESFLGAVASRRITLNEARINLLGEGIDELRHMTDVARRGTLPDTPTFLIDTLEEQASRRESSGSIQSSEIYAGVPQEDESENREDGTEDSVNDWEKVEPSTTGQQLPVDLGEETDTDNDHDKMVRAAERLAIEELLAQEQQWAAAPPTSPLSDTEGQTGATAESLISELLSGLEREGKSPTVQQDGGNVPNLNRAPQTKALPYLAGPMPPQIKDQVSTKRVEGAGEQVRIQAEFLDLLVNRSNEMAIYRSRLEQQLSSLRVVVAELGRTNMRMRDQLRRLDGETEAQIVARYQREKTANDTSFDPLELDRFSSLQQLTRALAESSDDFNGLHDTLEALSRQYDQLLQQQSRVSSELQEGLLRARLLPFDKMAPRLSRIVRQSAGDIGKKVRLDIDRAHGELDRNVLDRIVSPLEHMIRNSIAHGIEMPQVRREKGKPEEGTIRLSMRNEGAEIVIEVADDGAGLDREAIRKRGIDRGLIKEEDTLTDRALDDLIFASGFSTSEKVNQLSGRGVGMDVVRSEVRQLGGSVEINSVSGLGVKFILRLPQKMAVTQAIHVRVGETIFAVPASSIIGIGKGEEKQNVYPYSGVNYPIVTLRQLTGIRGLDGRALGDDHSALLLVRSGDLSVAVKVDQVLGNREIVVKQVGTHIAEVPGIYGATINEAGQVVVILDLAPMVRHFMSRPIREDQNTNAVKEARAPLVMVVDDSITMRKVTGRVLERHKFDVKTARDGVDALEVLESSVPDLMLLDIEMPRMDGYELATRMRADERYKNIPIIMITSRTGEKHRQRAMHIGVQKYLGKPYQEADLLRHIHEILGMPSYIDGSEEDGAGTL